MFKRKSEATEYAGSVSSPTEALLLQYLLNNAISELARDKEYLESTSRGASVDLLLFVKALRASTRNLETLSGILNGKIKSLEETPFAW